ncbi:MAG: hypothetical protein AB7O59_24115 [Pirellulales bacterium]
MLKMSPAERAQLIKRMKSLNARLQDPRLPLARVEELHRERAVLHAQLLADRMPGCAEPASVKREPT